MGGAKAMQKGKPCIMRYVDMSGVGKDGAFTLLDFSGNK